jgi:hypothetical protein
MNMHVSVFDSNNNKEIFSYENGAKEMPNKGDYIECENGINWEVVSKCHYFKAERAMGSKILKRSVTLSVIECDSK